MTTENRGVTAAGTVLDGNETSNLVNSNDSRLIARDVDAERAAQGYFARSHSGFTPEEATGDFSKVKRDGMYVAVADGDYRDTDIITMPGGFEMTVEQAKEVGIIDRDARIIDGNSMADDPAGEELEPQPEPYVDPATRPLPLPQDVASVQQAFGMHLGETEGAELFGNVAREYLDSGELSPGTLETLSARLGMGPQLATDIVSNSMASLTRSAAEALGGGDEGQQRMAFLGQAMRTGDHLVRSTIKASLHKHAMGQMSRKDWADLYGAIHRRWNGN